MKNEKQPNPNVIHPIKGYDKEIYIKPAISPPIRQVVSAYIDKF